MQIPSDQHWFATGFIFQPDQKYSLVASGVWYDDKINCPPTGYKLQDKVAEVLWPFFRMVEPLRPVDTGDTWFQLIGRVGTTTFVIGDGCSFTSHEGGELFCTANDCPFMYWNNSGAVELDIT